MLTTRRLAAAAASGSGKPAGSAWESFKTKFKSRFMIGDTWEHYIPPRQGFPRNHDSKYTAQQDSQAEYRVPAPGSQPEPNIPRGYPETEFDISLAKRPSLKLTPAAGAPVPAAWAEYERMPGVSPKGVRYIPRHVPQPAWVYEPEQIKRMRRFQLETGIHLVGMPYFAQQQPAYYPVQQYQTREEWEKVDVIRDIRIPRL